MHGLLEEVAIVKLCNPKELVVCDVFHLAHTTILALSSVEEPFPIFSYLFTVSSKDVLINC